MSYSVTTILSRFDDRPIDSPRQRTCWAYVISLAMALTVAEMRADEPPVNGDAVIRGGTAANEIVITTTSRLAGAIHSLKWHGREFIDSADHGRQLQSASSFDNTRDAGAETFNPTEAGSRRDGAGANSTSRLLSLETTETTLRTRSQMAFWLEAGEKSVGQPARNTEKLSRHILKKQVTIGHRDWPDVLNYRVTFTLPADEPHQQAQFEVLTGYMPPAFESFYRFDRSKRQLVPLTDGPGEQPDPIVFSTADGEHALGIIALTVPQSMQTGPAYGRWRFVPEKVVKWNCVVRDQQPHEATDYAFEVLVPIGTRSRVEAIMAALNSP